MARILAVIRVFGLLAAGWFPAIPEAAAAGPIEEARQVHGLSAAELSSKPPVHLRGVVLHRYPKRASFILQDDSDAIFIDLYPAHLPLPAEIVSGALVEVKGQAIAGQFAPMIVVLEAGDLRRTGAAPLPAAVPLTAEAAQAGQLDAHLVVAEGIVRRAPPTPISYATPALEIVFENTRLYAYLDAEPAGFGDLVDARVRVTGICSGIWNRQGQITAPCLMARDRADITVLEPPPVDPFSLPVTNSGDILRYHLDNSPGHRIHVVGVVLHSLPDGRVFVYNSERAVRVECATPPSATAGDEVDAVGFPSMRDRCPMLEDAVLRTRSRQAPLPEPIPRRAETVDQQSQDYELIQLPAVLLETQRTEAGVDLLVQDGGKLFKASLEDSSGVEALFRLKPGSTLSLRGLVLFSFPPRTTQVSRPNGFSLLLRSPDDVRVIHAAPWWTVQRTFGLFGAAAALALCFGLWNHFLRARARAQQEIISAQARREATSEERSRLARELHDTLEQEFVGMTRQTEALEQAGLATPRAHETLLVLRQMLRLSRDNARRAVWDLRDPALLDCGVEDAVRNAVERIVHGTPVAVQFDAIMKSPAAMSPQVQLNILRLAQEAVTNALKHSNCTSIRVVLRHRDGVVELDVMNDGQSLESSNVAEAGHFGVIGMRERCEKLGGRFEFRPAPEGGAVVHAEIPTAPPHP